MYIDSKVINPKNVNTKTKILFLGSFIFLVLYLVPVDELDYRIDGPL